MKRNGFPAKLFGKPQAATLALAQPLTCLRAVLMTDARRIRCGELTVEDAWPVMALCRALVAAGAGDIGLVITWPGGEPAGTIWSISEVAAWPPEPAEPGRRRGAR